MTPNSILEIIGNTPTVRLTRVSEDLGLNVFGKIEGLNPGGSIKDRTSLAMIQNGVACGKISATTTIVESSSGNMAIGLAQVCSYYGLKLIIVTDTKVNPHTLQMLRAYGAQIEMVNKPCIGSGLLGARLNKVKELLAVIPNSFSPNQYKNKLNPQTHFQTMAEIHQAVQHIDYVLVATSTCGTLMGCASYLEENSPQTQLIAVDAIGSVIFGQPPCSRLIPGHGSGMPSSFLKKNSVHQVVAISDEECVEGCHYLLEKESILAGGSSGAVVSALHQIKSTIPNGSRCVLMLPDRGERYLDTIYNPNWVTENFETVTPEKRKVSL